MNSEMYAIMEHHNKLLMALLTEPDIVNEGIVDKVKTGATVVKNTIIKIINRIIGIFRKFLGIFKKEKKTKEKSVKTVEVSQDIVKNKEKTMAKLQDRVDKEAIDQIDKYIKNLEAIAIPVPGRIFFLIRRFEYCLDDNMDDDMGKSIEIAAHKLSVEVADNSLEALKDALNEFMYTQALGDIKQNVKDSILSLYRGIDIRFNESVKKLEALKNEINKSSEDNPRQELLNKVTICETVQNAIVHKFNELMHRLNIMDSLVEKIAKSVEEHKKDPNVSEYFPFMQYYSDNKSKKYNFDALMSSNKYTLTI